MKKEFAFPLLLIGMACGNGNQDLFSGTIEIENVRISARVSGLAEEVHVTQGDEVTEGQVLVSIDPTEYQLALTQAEAALTIAEANLITITEGTREQQIIAASSAVSAARAVRSQALADLERAQELSLSGAISNQQLEAAETNAVHAQTQFTTAQQNYSLALEGARASELEAVQAAVESATAARDLARRRIDWTSVSSPLEGLITATNIEKGENISPGITLLTVADTDTVKAIFYVSQPYLATTEIGSGVTVATNSIDDTIQVSGTITYISESAEFTPSQVETREGRTSLVYRVEAEIPNTRNTFKAGMPVDVLINQSQE